MPRKQDADGPNTHAAAGLTTLGAQNYASTRMFSAPGEAHREDRSDKRVQKGFDTPAGAAGISPLLDVLSARERADGKKFVMSGSLAAGVGTDAMSKQLTTLMPPDAGGGRRVLDGAFS